MKTYISYCSSAITKIINLVYGAMSKIGPLQIFLLFFGYFASSNPSLPESSCRHFFPCMYGCHLKFKIPIYTGIKKSTYSNQVEKHVILFVYHKDSKNVWFAVCPMFRNVVMGQNVKGH